MCFGKFSMIFLNTPLFASLKTQLFRSLMFPLHAACVFVSMHGGVSRSGQSLTLLFTDEFAMGCTLSRNLNQFCLGVDLNPLPLDCSPPCPTSAHYTIEHPPLHNGTYRY